MIEMVFGLANSNFWKRIDADRPKNSRWNDFMDAVIDKVPIALW